LSKKKGKFPRSGTSLLESRGGSKGAWKKKHMGGSYKGDTAGSQGRKNLECGSLWGNAGCRFSGRKIVRRNTLQTRVGQAARGQDYQGGSRGVGRLWRQGEGGGRKKRVVIWGLGERTKSTKVGARRLLRGRKP